MPLPSDTRQLADVAATTLDAFLKELVENVFESKALFVRLASRDRIILDGGDKIRQSIIYDKLNSDWYSGLDEFDVSRKLTKTPMIFSWKQIWANISIDGLSMLQNAGADALFNVRAALGFEDDGVDAVAVQKLPEQQACRARANDGDLGAHGGCLRMDWNRSGNHCWRAS
jgi:hypothetical protein